MQSATEATSYFARRRILDSAASSAGAELSAAGTGDGHDLLSFLATAQCNEVDFLPITWQAELGNVGAGGTSQIQQSFLNLDLSYVFKRIHRGIDEPYAFRALDSEIAILGHKDIRGHPNIVRLVGITWDVASSSEAIWPTLVFRKSEHGDLRRFMKSGAGKNMDFDSRLKLCHDIATGIATLHEAGVVHGDIKPMNVLIFSERRGRETVYTAQVGDLGYSTMTQKELEDAKDVHLPISWPWNAPEVTNLNSSFSADEAKLADMFSLGFVCLWLLFPGELLEMGVNVERPDLDVEWKGDGELERIALAVVQRRFHLLDSRRVALDELFASTLATDPDQRDLDIRSFLEKATDLSFVKPHSQVVSNYDMYMPYLRWMPNHKDFDVAAAQSAYYGYSYNNAYASAYMSQNPYASEGQIEAPRETKTPSSHASEVTEDPKPQDYRFLVWKSFRQLVQADYRIWTTILKALEKKSSGQDLEQKQNAAFQLAFCYKTGFGTAPAPSKVSEYLEQCGQTEEDLLKEINIIKEDKNPLIFKNLETEIESMDHITHYLKSTELEDVELAYSQIAGASNQLFGKDHKTSIHLNRMLGYTFLAQGQLSNAETEFTKLASVCEEYYGPTHPDTLACLSSVAHCHRSQGNLKEAEKGIIKVLNTQAKMHSSKAETQVPALRQLASIYKEQKRWKEAEGLEQKVLRITERNLGKCHVDTLVAASDLVDNYKHQGSLHKAEVLAVDLMNRAVVHYGEEDSRALESMDLLVSLFENMGNFNAAKNLTSRATDIRIRTLSPDDEDITNSLATQVKMHAGAGDLKKAIEIQREAVARNKKIYGETDRYTITSIELLAALLAKLQNYPEAIELMTAVVTHRQLAQGDSDPDTLNSIQSLAEYKSREEASAKARDRLATFLEKNAAKVPPESLARETTAKSSAVLALPNVVSDAVNEPLHIPLTSRQSTGYNSTSLTTRSDTQLLGYLPCQVSAKMPTDGMGSVHETEKTTPTTPTTPEFTFWDDGTLSTNHVSEEQQEGLIEHLSTYYGANTVTLHEPYIIIRHEPDVSRDQAAARPFSIAGLIAIWVAGHEDDNSKFFLPSVGSSPISFFEVDIPEEHLKELQKHPSIMPSDSALEFLAEVIFPGYESIAIVWTELVVVYPETSIAEFGRLLRDLPYDIKGCPFSLTYRNGYFMTVELARPHRKVKPKAVHELFDHPGKPLNSEAPVEDYTNYIQRDGKFYTKPIKLMAETETKIGDQFLVESFAGEIERLYFAGITLRKMRSNRTEASPVISRGGPIPEPDEKYVMLKQSIFIGNGNRYQHPSTPEGSYGAVLVRCSSIAKVDDQYQKTDVLDQGCIFGMLHPKNIQLETMSANDTLLFADAFDRLLEEGWEVDQFEGEDFGSQTEAELDIPPKKHRKTKKSLPKLLHKQYNLRSHD
ncbi:hypothetical protein ABW21_db0201609 [Orbilia brochopaga]|nr:hypothetical protein ABW21_db0201609 [Drechslerella brochopaga]